MTDSEALRIVEAMIHRRNGFLPEDGGWTSQPNRMWYLMGVAEKEYVELENGRNQDRPEHSS